MAKQLWRRAWGDRERKRVRQWECFKEEMKEETKETRTEREGRGRELKQYVVDRKKERITRGREPLSKEKERRRKEKQSKQLHVNHRDKR